MIFSFLAADLLAENIAAHCSQPGSRNEVIWEEIVLLTQYAISGIFKMR